MMNFVFKMMNFVCNICDKQVELGGGGPPGTIILAREEVLSSNGDIWPSDTSARLKGSGCIFKRF